MNYFITVDTSGKTVGPKEYSGFVHSYNDEPITFIPGNPHKNDKPVSISSVFMYRENSGIGLIIGL